MTSFTCSECNSTTEYDDIHEDVKSTAVIVCPSCKTLHDVHSHNITKKSKYDKTNYHNKIKGIENQLDMLGSRGLGSKPYTVPCPHCSHIWEMKGILIKSVNYCPKCYQYFGIDDVRISMNHSTKEFKTDFQVTAIYPNSIRSYDIDKLADFWSNINKNKREGEEKEKELESSV